MVGVEGSDSIAWGGSWTTFSSLAGLGVFSGIGLEVNEFKVVSGVKFDGLGVGSCKCLDGVFLDSWLCIKWSSNKQTHGGHSWGSLLSWGLYRANLDRIF